VYEFVARERLSVCNALPTSAHTKVVAGMAPLPLRRALAVCWERPAAAAETSVRV
jgi:hypothetical protein